MDEDWASDGDDDGDLVDTSNLPPIPEVEVAVSTSSVSEPSPPPNAWKNQSGDVRLATRLGAGQNQTPSQIQPTANKFRNGPPPRRDNIPRSAPPPSGARNNSTNNPGRAFSNVGRSSSWGASGNNEVTYYVTNLPQTNENDIASFFADHGINTISVRITRHADSGNFKAAFVTVNQSQCQQGLDLDGTMFGSRTMHIKIDGVDRDNRRNGRDRGGFNSVSYGGAFGRDRRGFEDSGNTGTRNWSSSNNGNRISNNQGSDGPSDRRFRNDRDGTRPNRGTGGGRDQLPKDSTIPTGPVPSGRKKLQLKPRTKPPPVLEVDQRAIDPPRSTGVGSSSFPVPKKTGSEKKMPEDTEEWEMAKDTGAPRAPVPRQNGGKKEDDSKRPVLLNTFAALEINDTDS